MRPYSLDLRERVAAAVDHYEGSIRWIARVFRVSTCFIVRLLQRRPRRHRDARPRPSGRATWGGSPAWSASSPTPRWSNCGGGAASGVA